MSFPNTRTTTRPLVSVVIPTYNRADRLPAALDSVRAQSYRPIELVVVDDGSTDKTKQVFAAWTDTVSSDDGLQIRYEWQGNRGAPAARNRGIDRATGRYLKLLDSDDRLLPGALTQQVQQARRVEEKDPRGIVFGDEWIDDGSEVPFRRPPSPQRPEESDLGYMLRVFLQTSLPLHRTRYLREIGGFDEELPFSQERDLHVRLVMHDVHFHHEPADVVVVAKTGEDRITTQDKWSGDKDHFWVRRQIIRKLEEENRMTPPLRKQWASGFWAMGRKAIREGYPEQAEKYFRFARQLSDRPAHGSIVYRLLLFFLDPLSTEQLLTFVKKAVPSW